MKLLVIGIDALIPSLVFDNINEYPNMSKLIDNGVSGEYDGYIYGYGSRDNWVSIYTGLEPKEHQVINNMYSSKEREPRLYDYSNQQTFWKVLNSNGYKVGMWKALSTTPPERVDGYMVSGEPSFLTSDCEIVSDAPLVHEKDEELINNISQEVPQPPYPQTPESLGYSWEEIFKQSDILKNLLTEDYFEEGLDYLSAILDYSLDSIKKINAIEKVDMLWFYDAVFDYLAHFQMHDKKRVVIKRAIKRIDQFIGELISLLQPDNVIVLSDHGQKSLIDHFPNSDVQLQKEAFGLSEQSVFFDNNIVMKARNGGFLSSVHSLKAFIILSGKGFKQGTISNMRTLDIYPTILELFDCKVDENRKGFIHPVFRKDKLVNYDREYDYSPSLRSKILLIQTSDVSITNKFINKYYNEHRFSDIYILGKSRYKNIFLENEQVKGFVSKEEYEKSLFDKVVVPYSSDKLGTIDFFEI